MSPLLTAMRYFCNPISIATSASTKLLLLYITVTAIAAVHWTYKNRQKSFTNLIKVVMYSKTVILTWILFLVTRNWHQWSRACAGNPDSSAIEGEEHARHRERSAGLRCHFQRRHPAHHWSDWNCGRHWARHRVRRSASFLANAILCWTYSRL